MVPVPVSEVGMAGCICWGEAASSVFPSPLSPGAVPPVLGPHPTLKWNSLPLRIPQLGSIIRFNEAN